MKFFAILLLFIAIAAVLTDVSCIWNYVKISSVRWDHIFRTERQHHYFMMTLGAMVFAIIPSMAAICSLGAWIIFKHLDHISDEGHDA